jgi:hypothetical protein
MLDVNLLAAMFAKLQPVDKIFQVPGPDGDYIQVLRSKIVTPEYHVPLIRDMVMSEATDIANTPRDNPRAILDLVGRGPDDFGYYWYILNKEKTKKAIGK